MPARVIKLSGEGVGKETFQASRCWFLLPTLHTGEQRRRPDNAAWVLTSVSCRETKTTTEQEGEGRVNGKLFTQLSPLNAKWLVFTSVKFLSILSGYLLFFPNGLLTEQRDRSMDAA